MFCFFFCFFFFQLLFDKAILISIFVVVLDVCNAIFHQGVVGPQVSDGTKDVNGEAWELSKCF